MESPQLVFLLITKSFDYGKNVTWRNVDLQLARYLVLHRSYSVVKKMYY